ncbi:MAG: hypothetical protein MUC62_02630 [Candidatus Thermoplasmatota archaeon]|nr:hypothetical protein [Candidatus Thermoplasmatota archaeon]
MSVTISLRVDEGTLEEISATGMKPSSYIKALLEKELRKERSRNALRRLKAGRIGRKGRSCVEMIRQDRDSR